MAVIGNHNGDSLANTYSNARNTYNGVSAYPTTKFDGVLSHVGGGSTSLYGTFLPKVNQRNAVLCNFTVDIAFEHLTGNDYHATITVEKVADYAGTNLVLQLVITESKLDINWGLGEFVNGANRKMVPSQNGTPLNFSGSSTQVVELDFTMAGYWVLENCELIAFVQDNSSKEILQADLKSMAVAEYSLDAELTSVVNIPDKLCHGVIEPIVEIKNRGADILTSLNINFDVNGELIYTYPWTGSLEFLDLETVSIPQFSFDALTENEIAVYVSDPNYGTDLNPENNEIMVMTAATPVCTEYVALLLRTDGFPEQTTWECLGPNGQVLGSGGPYTQTYSYIYDTIFFEFPGCYQFFMYDSNGDGLITYYSLRSFVDGEITTIRNGGAFTYAEETQFTAESDGVMAAFSSNVSEGCDNLTVQFSDESLGSVTEWSWEFEGGDPATSTEQNPSVLFASPGMYDVSLTVSDGTNTNTFDVQDFITVFASPNVELGVMEDQCLDWPGFELTGGTPAGGEYSGTGVVDGWFYPQTAGLGTHTITYTYMDGNDCENSAAQEIFVDACTGINEVSQNNVLRIYPNPVTSQATIEFFVTEKSDVTVSIYNSIGMMLKEISNGTMDNGSHTLNINMGDFENGIYFISFKAGENIATQKMTIVR